MNDRPAFRTAGLSALLAIPAVVLSAIFLALFFGGAGAWFGPLNDISVAATTCLLILPARAVLSVVEVEGGRSRPWFAVVTWVAIAGLAAVTFGQVLVAVEAISLEASFAIGGLGVLPIIAWIVAQATIGLRLGLPSRAVGWWLVAILVTTAAITAGSTVGSEPAVWLATIAFLVAISGYFATLGLELLPRASGAAAAAPDAVS